MGLFEIGDGSLKDKTAGNKATIMRIRCAKWTEKNSSPFYIVPCSQNTNLVY